jgi:putative Holliday junction resolvase
VPSPPTGSDPKPHSPRILGLDVGSKTIGLAVSDPLGITAQGLETIRRQNKHLDFEQLDRVIREYQVTEIVVGLPLRMSGAEGIQAEKMQGFAEQLRQRFQGPVHLWDERLSSAQANRVLRDSEMSIKRRGEVVDRLAAVLILQSWMDHREMKQNSRSPPA